MNNNRSNIGIIAPKNNKIKQIIHDIQVFNLEIHHYENSISLLNAIPYRELDCLLIDIHCSNKLCIQVLSDIREEQLILPVIIMNFSNNIPLTINVIRHGAFDVLVDPIHPQMLIEAINKAFRWRHSEKTHRDEHRKINSLVKQLTARQYDVMTLLLEGLTNREIAERLDIATCTVEIHRAHIFKKMNVRNLVGLIRTLHTFESLKKNARKSPLEENSN